MSNELVLVLLKDYTSLKQQLLLKCTCKYTENEYPSVNERLYRLQERAFLILREHQQAQHRTLRKANSWFRRRRPHHEDDVILPFG